MNALQEAIDAFYYKLKDSIHVLEMNELGKPTEVRDLFSVVDEPKIISKLKIIEKEIDTIRNTPTESISYKAWKYDIETGERKAREIVEFQSLLLDRLREEVKQDFVEMVNDFCAKHKITVKFTKRTLVEYLFDNYIYFAHHNHQILKDEDGKYYNYTEKDSIHYVRDIMYEIFAFRFSFKEYNRSVLESLEFKFINDSKIYKVI